MNKNTIRKILKVLLYLIFVISGLAILTSLYWKNIFLLLALAFLVYIIETKRINKRIKLAVVLLILIAVAGYILYPKNISDCGVIPDESGGTSAACGTISCVGIPFHGFNAPVCLGISNWVER